MTLEEMAKIVEAEAGVLDFNGKLGVAQCIADNNYNAKAFTTPADYYSGQSLTAANAVMNQGFKRFEGWKVLQIRSFTNYERQDGTFDWSKEKWALDLDLIPKKDGIGKWGHFYLGKCIDPLKKYCGCGIATYQALEEMNVRNDANILGKLVGTIPNGAKVEVLEFMQNGWMRIVSPSPASPLGYAYVSNVNDKYFKRV